MLGPRQRVESGNGSNANHDWLELICEDCWLGWKLKFGNLSQEPGVGWTFESIDFWRSKASTFGRIAIK